jgi:hypothetical protein
VDRTIGLSFSGIKGMYWRNWEEGGVDGTIGLSFSGIKGMYWRNGREGGGDRARGRR